MSELESQQVESSPVIAVVEPEKPVKVEIQKVEENENAPIISYINSLNEEYKPKSNCKFCQSNCRVEAEELFEKTNSPKQVHQFLKEKGTSITYENVRSHIINHYKKQERILKMKEYGKDLKKWRGRIIDRRESIKERIVMLNNEMVIVASETEGSDLLIRLKSIETMAKISSTISDMESKLDEMDKGLEPALIVIEKIKDIISLRIKKTTNEDMKRVFMSLLEELAVSLKDVSIPVPESL